MIEVWNISLEDADSMLITKDGQIKQCLLFLVCIRLTSCETRWFGFDGDIADDGDVKDIDTARSFSCRCRRLALTSCRRAARSSSVRIKSFCIPTAKHFARRHVGHCRRVRSFTGQWPPKRQGGKA